MIEQRTTIRQRLDLAHLVLVDDKTYRHALQMHHMSIQMIEKLAKYTRRKPCRRAAMLLSGLRLLYSQKLKADEKEYPNQRVMLSMSVDFLEYAVENLPEGPEGAPLRSMITRALTIWEAHNNFKNSRSVPPSTSIVGVGPGTGRPS